MAALASVVLATLLLMACQSSQHRQLPSRLNRRPPLPKRSTWYSKVPGPSLPIRKTPTASLRSRPKPRPSRFNRASAHNVLASGIYDSPSQPATDRQAATIDPTILQAKIDPQSVQHALDTKARYAIRLPKPDAYLRPPTAAAPAPPIRPMLRPKRTTPPPSRCATPLAR